MPITVARTQVDALAQMYAMASSEEINNHIRMPMYYSLVKETLQPHVHSKNNRNGTDGIEVARTSTGSNCTRVLIILRLSGVARYDVVVHEKSSILCIRYTPPN